jgi:hypothetical protein
MSQQTDADENGEEPDAVPFYPEKGPDPDEMAASYLPEGDDWEAKTILDISDPAAVSALKQFGQMYPEIDDLQPIVDEFLDHFLKTRTSVSGQSREEYRNILMSMYGGSIDEETARGAFVDALAAGADDD